MPEDIVVENFEGLLRSKLQDPIARHGVLARLHLDLPERQAGYHSIRLGNDIKLVASAWAHLAELHVSKHFSDLQGTESVVLDRGEHRAMNKNAEKVDLVALLAQKLVPAEGQHLECLLH